MFHFADGGARYVLASATELPRASAFLWNRQMMFQISCRGYAVAQFMQPEPTKYAHVPTLAGVHFMLPEEQPFAHHPGRFFYVRDDESGELFSAPYEPVRKKMDRFEFAPGTHDIRWHVECGGIAVELVVSLPAEGTFELWSATVRNLSGRVRRVSLVPYFPVGFSSWMNMSAGYEPAVNGIVARRVAAYQRTEDYFKQKDFKELTFLVSDRTPVAWEANQAAFEGEGHLSAPAALSQPELGCGDALHEIPTCALQYRFELTPDAREDVTLAFGAARTLAEVAAIARTCSAPERVEFCRREYQGYLSSGRGCVQVEVPDEYFQNFVNHWLPRQVFYHGDTQRLSTDPQTRNYLQDAMGTVYVDASRARRVLLHALSQQKSSGQMPDGVVLVPGAELKYINRIPHTDHSVWLVLLTEAYLAETGDYAVLNERVPFVDGAETTVLRHLELSLQWLLQDRDARGLSYIAQGDWCDPMNMVGYRGQGVSGWLTEALCYALRSWETICQSIGRNDLATVAAEASRELVEVINQWLWDGSWYARGITDEGRRFGVQADAEGQIFLNTQSFALLAGAPSAEQQARLLAAVDDRLLGPFGVELLAPSFTSMREDIGRVTQKFPGTAENGSVYNHAAAFYAAALYQVREAERAFEVLRKMIPGPAPEDLMRRGQLPVFIPNYYRGAHRQFPRTAGRSSQLFNTGTVAWFYRALVERLLGLRGSAEGLVIDPQLPAAWPHARAWRRFRGAELEVEYRRAAGAPLTVQLDGVVLPERVLREVVPGRRYQLLVTLPG